MSTIPLDIIQILDELRNNSLYVHNADFKELSFNIPEFKTRPVYLVETLATINALVKKGTMLLYGGHGGGKTTLSKYLGQIFHGKTITEIEQSILRGHPQLTEEKILGSLNFKQMLDPSLIPENGNIEVKWNSFIKSPWKIIDEINRLSPYAQNILLSLLAEGVVKYHDQSFQVGNFTVFATMNPPDEGNYELPIPFMDRFALALPITMPDYASMQTIGKKDKLSIKESFPFSLKENIIYDIQDEISELKYELEAEEFIDNIIADYRLCDRTQKEANESQTVDNGLCTYGIECRYYKPFLVCNKIVNPLSVRVKEDLYRYGRAIAWYLGYERVTSTHIKAIAPYLIWHRSKLSRKYINENNKEYIDNNIFIVNPELEGTKKIIDLIHNRFTKRYPEFIIKYKKALNAELQILELEKLISDSMSVEDDLLIKKEIYPGLIKLHEIYDLIKEHTSKIENVESVKELLQIKNDLKRAYNIQNRQILSERIDRLIAIKKIQGFEIEKYIVSDSKTISDGKIKERLMDEYGHSLEFELHKEATLSKNSEEFVLTVKPTRSGLGFKLLFKYQGPQNEITNELFKFGTKQ